MNLLLSNFARRLADYARQNRVRLIKFCVILAACLLGALLIYYAVEEFHSWRFAKKVEAIDKRIEEKDAEIKAAESYINALKTEIAAKDALLEELDRQGRAAQKVVERTRTEVVYLEKEYEDIRSKPVPDAPVALADVCAKLERLSYSCR